MSKINVSSLILPLIFQGYVSLFVFGFVDNSRGPYFPDIINDLQLSDARASWFFVTTSSVALVGSQITPIILRHLSLQVAIRLSLVLMGLSLLALSYVENFWQMVFVTAILGIFFGLINVMQNLCIQFGSSVDLRPRLFSGLHAMYALSSLIGPLIIAWLSAVGFGWRPGFRFFGLIMVAAGLLSFLLKSKPLYEKKKEKTDGLLSNWKTDYDWKVLTLAFCMAFYIAGELSISSRMVLYLRRSLNYSVEDASFMLSVFFGLLFVGRVISAFTKIKTSQLPKIIFYALTASIFTYILGITIDERFLALSGFTFAPFFGVYLAYMGQALQDRVVKAMSFALAAGTLTVVPMHLAIGYLTDHFGLQTALWVGPGCLFVALVLFVEFNRRVKI